MTDNEKQLTQDDKDQKMQALRDMITTAEQTMQSAKAMLLQLEGKKKVGRKKKVDEGDGAVVQGTFDGQIMVGTDGKQYPVAANYASKSKLVEGDMLKLTIADNGAFIYKQVGPTPRQNKIGIVGQDASGNFFVASDGKPYKVLLASITYFDVSPGDQVAIVTSQDENAEWASIEALLQHNDSSAAPAIDSLEKTLPKEPESLEPKTATELLTGSSASISDVLVDDIIDESTDKTVITNDEDVDTPQQSDENSDSSTDDTAMLDETSGIIDEWVPDIDEIEKEIRAEMQQS